MKSHGVRSMQSLQAREAKAKFSALLEAAERGEPTMITRHGRPSAVVMPVTEAEKVYPADRPSMADLLLSFPGGIAFERDRTPMREIDL